MTFAVKNTQLFSSFFFFFFFLKLIIATLPYLAHPRISNTLPFELSIPLLPKTSPYLLLLPSFPPSPSDSDSDFSAPFRTITIFNTNVYLKSIKNIPYLLTTLTMYVDEFFF